MNGPQRTSNRILYCSRSSRLRGLAGGALESYGDAVTEIPVRDMSFGYTTLEDVNSLHFDISFSRAFKLNSTDHVPFKHLCCLIECCRFTSFAYYHILCLSIALDLKDSTTSLPCPCISPPPIPDHRSSQSFHTIYLWATCAFQLYQHRCFWQTAP